jgi:hypothetical protein
MTPGKHPRTVSIWLVPLLCLALLTSACSSRFSYNFLDWWMMWQVRQHVSLDRDQRRLVRENVREFHEWHRETQLPRYAQYLRGALTRLEAEIDEQALEALVQEAASLWRDSMNQLLPPTTELLSSLSQAQTRELLNNIEKTQRDWRERDAKRSPRERMRENAEKWVGSLTEQQQAWVEDWLDTLKPVKEESAATHALWREKFSEALAKRSEAGQLEHALKTLVLDDEQFYSETYRKKLAHNRRATLALIARINNNLNEQQREHRREAIMSYVRDFERLAGID